MPQIQPIEFNLPPAREQNLRAAGEDQQGIRLGLAIAGGALGASVGLLATVAAGIETSNPVAWLAIACAGAIGAVLGA